MSRWRVEADLDLCQGHQMCQAEAPQIFDWDPDERKVVLRQADPPDELRADAERAAVYCPAMALSVRVAPEEVR